MISICIKDNLLNMQDFLINKISNSHIPDIYYSKHNFKIYKNVIVHYTGNDTNKFYNLISNVISSAIVEFYEPKIVKKLLLKDYFYFEPYEKNTILEDFSSIYPKSNDRQICDDVENYIKENKSIVLDGFVSFRLKNYINNLNELLENAVSKFVLDKEYLQFVSLLKTYVDSKTPEPCIVNLIYINQEAILLDELGNIIDYVDFNSEYLSDITFSQNDYALNTLIEKLPQEILVHLICPKDEYIDTISLIFGDRVKICSGCEICSAYKLLNLNK